jgi:hypothetical protein
MDDMEADVLGVNGGSCKRKLLQRKKPIFVSVRERQSELRSLRRLFDQSSVKATITLPRFVLSGISPPTATTMYCLPSTE